MAGDWPRLDTSSLSGGIKKGHVVTFLGCGRVTKMYQVQIKHVSWSEWRDTAHAWLTSSSACEYIAWLRCQPTYKNDPELWSFRIVEV